MNYTVTKYPQGTFSWADFCSTDVIKSKEFLEKLFNWTSEDMPTTAGAPDYTMFYLDGQLVAGGSAPFAPGMPSFWTSYISVDNIDAMTAKVKELGGAVIMEPMDVLDVGRTSVIQDPTGAVVSLWEPKSHIGADVVNKVGAMCWNELYTPDIEKAKMFYGDLLGWTYDTAANDYVTIKNNGRANGGMFQMTPEMGAFPPNWTVYFTVANLDESLKTVTEMGGQIHMPVKDVAVGKIAMIADPVGCSMMLIEMSVTPEEWVE